MPKGWHVGVVNKQMGTQKRVQSTLKCVRGVVYQYVPVAYSMY